MTASADRIPLAQVRDLLRVGHALPFRVLDAAGRLLLNQGQALVDDAQFDALIERGAWAERPMVEAERQARAAAARAAEIVPEISLFDRWERLLWQFDKLARALVRGQARGELILPLFESLQALVEREPDVALFLGVRQEDRRFALYPLQHSLRCAVVALLTSRQLGWATPACSSLGLAALTMNLATLELQAVMAEQDTPPTRKQIDQIRGHPQATVALLRSAGIEDEDWLATVAQHHERLGGGGYPLGLGDVTQPAQVLRAADVYMAKISSRANRPAMAPPLAIRQLFQDRPGDPLAMAMIKAVGIYPPGCLVRLQSGEIGVVVRRPAAGPHPLVATLSGKDGRPSGETHRRDTAPEEFRITGACPETAAFARVLPERVYGLMSL